MLNTVRFVATALVGTNKTGKLTPDADGYYTLVLGALNVLNSAGAYYPYEPAKELFTESSQLMRRIARGALRGEYGHPKREAGQDLDSYANRIMQIYEDKVCCHIKEVFLDFDSIKDEAGQPVIAIFGKVRPSGPMGPALQASLENKDENVCFSIRSFTQDDRVRGRTEKVLKTIVTWDYVNEPGIKYANKYSNPGLEALTEETFSRGNIERVAKSMSKGMGMESAVMTMEELFDACGWKRPTGIKPGYLNWEA